MAEKMKRFDGEFHLGLPGSHWGEMIKVVNKEVLALFYMDDVALDGPACRNAQLMYILVQHGPNFSYFPEPVK
eukprot:6807991-Ditylum_brightwellii.AAC.2